MSQGVTPDVMRFRRLTTRRLMVLVAAMAAVLAICVEFDRLRPGQQDTLIGITIILAVPLSPLLLANLAALLGDPDPPR